MSVLIPNHYSATAALIYVSFVCLASIVHLYRKFSGGLSRVPSAHWTCAFSPLWILWHRYHGTELKAVLASHQKLGKIVRVGPREISISDFETGVAQVYNAGFEKPHYFDFFQYYGQLNSFASKTRADHAACRKRVSPSYSKSTLFNSKSLPKIIHKIVYQRLVPVLQDHIKAGEPVQLLPLFYAASLDALNCYILGIASGPNFTQDPNLTETWLRHYENRYAPQSFWLQEVPWLAQGLGRLGWDVMPRVHYTSTKWVEDWMLEHCDRAETVYQEMLRGEDVALEDVPVVYHQIRKSMSKLESENANFLGMPVTERRSRLSIASEIFDHMSGAREVFGMVLSYAIYYIAQHPEQQARLQREVSRLGLHLSQQHGADDFPEAATPQAIESLSYLQAVINESLRMRPNSTPLPRITPKGKSVSISGVDDIPPSTRVNCFQWFLHRDPALWPEPDKWIPERWLDEKTGLLKRAGELPPLWAFVTGPRSCIGAQLTYYSFGYMLASLFANFSVEVARPETYLRHSPGSLEDELYVSLRPLGGSDEKESCSLLPHDGGSCLHRQYEDLGRKVRPRRWRGYCIVHLPTSNPLAMPRKGFEKARTGCITCKARKVKCDEARPHCARCRKSGRACAGYAAAPLGSYSWLRLLQVRPSTIPSDGDGRHNSLEMRSLDYFRCVVAPALSGPMHTYFWTKPVQQLSMQDFPIRQAVLAISLLYEKFDDQAHHHDKASCHDATKRREWAALACYNRALKEIATSDNLDINLVLFLVILFTCIECLQDNYVAAIAHCRHGVRLLRSCRNAPPEIFPIVHHLSIFPFCFGATLLDFPLLPSRTISPDETFQDIYEAGQYMDVLMSRTVRLVRVTNPYQYVVPGVSDTPAVHCISSLHELHKDLDIWLTGLLELQSRDRETAPPGSSHAAIHRTVEMRWLVCKSWVQTGLCQDENSDAHLAHFERIIQLGREELADREFAGTAGRKSVFTFDMGASPLLHFAALKCRSLPLRLQALVLMEKLMCPRETVWNANVMRATSRRTVELEHDIQLPPILSGLPV